MENAYGIGITNRYSCFLDNEDDPVEALKATEVDKDAKKKETGSVTAPAGARKGIRDSNKGGNEANKQNNKITNNGVGGRPARGPRPTGQDQKNVKFNEEDREDRNNRRNRDDAPREGRVEGDFNRGPRRPGQFKPRGAPGGRPRGPPGAPGGPRKREFDRQSGSDKSGVKPVDKREGAGSRNWGTYKDELEAENAPPTADETMDEKNDSQEITETGDAGEEKSAEQNENQEGAEDQGQKFMTLDEWKALQQPKEQPVFNIRKAGEGEDQSQWKKMILKKKEKEAESGEEEEEYEEDYECPQRAGRQKQILDIDFHFADSRRGGPGGRGGRGGRGGGGRGGDRDRAPRPPRAGGDRAPAAAAAAAAAPAPGPPNTGGFRKRENRFGNRYETPRSQAAPKVDDVNDFPSLG